MLSKVHPSMINDNQCVIKQKKSKNNANQKHNIKSPPKQPTSIQKNIPIFTIEKIQDNFPEDYRKRRFILLDTETTGFEITSDRLISINAVEMIKGELTGMQFNAYLDKRFYESKPLMYYLSDYNYSRKDNIKKSLKTFLDFVKDDMIITHNAGFDMKFINRELNKYGLKEIPLNRCICTLKYFRNLKKIGIFDKNYGLRLCDLCRYYDINVDLKDLHQGIVDTIVFGRVVAKMFEDGICNFNDIKNNFNFNEINDLGRSLEDIHINNLNENSDNNIINDNNNINNDLIIKEKNFNDYKKEKNKNKVKYHCKSEEKKRKKKWNFNNFKFNNHKNKYYNNNNFIKKNSRKIKNKIVNNINNQNMNEFNDKIFPKKEEEKFNKSKSHNINYEQDEEVKINFIKNAFKSYISSNNIKY